MCKYAFPVLVMIAIATVIKNMPIGSIQARLPG